LRDESGAWKKVSGILTESNVQGESVLYVILGIGLNVNYTMRAYPELAPLATTLQDILGHSVDRARLLEQLLLTLDRYYARVRAGESLSQEYRSRLGMLGQVIRVASHDTILQGLAEDVDEDGGLILAQGNEHTTLFAGDVTILKEDREVP
jgi:BirA family biotin operon repressor/biotin-[acetyl-CoA-carboxylase] ligase